MTIGVPFPRAGRDGFGLLSAAHIVVLPIGNRPVLSETKYDLARCTQVKCVHAWLISPLLPRNGDTGCHLPRETWYV